jgi:transketolase
MTEQSSVTASTTKPSRTATLDDLCVNTIRCLAMDAVQKAKSGHPGMPMGMAPAGYVLWTRHLRYNPRNPQWINRDRFVLSGGHGCMLLYSLLHLTGFDLSLEELKNFRQWGSKTPGHPEYGHTPGVEATTGPLGQGLANAVGMALAEKYLAAYFNRDGFPVVDYRVYAFAGDGDMMEGVGSEACSLAGHLGLDNLIVVYDNNHISIDGSTSLAFTEDVARRFEAYHWNVIIVDGDGNDLSAIDNALTAAKREQRRPTIIVLRTHIGYGSPNKQDTAEAHGSPLGEEEVALTKKHLGWDPAKSFFIPEETLSHFREEVRKGEQREKDWGKLFAAYAAAHPDSAREFDRAREQKLPEQWDNLWETSRLTFDPASPLATREAQGKVLDALMPKLPLVLGGSADLTPSNNTRFKGVSDFSAENRLGRYVRYGVREHAMGGAMNGIALSRMLIPYGATFFAFTDYMRPALRMAAISRYPAVFVFTHDSIGLGEDGPTHQPVEHLASLRAMPGLILLRPADAYETQWAWKFALEHRSGPVLLALSRQKVAVLDPARYPSTSHLVRGAYVLADVPSPKVILIGSGTEVHVCLAAQEELMNQGIPARVVSMPSWELFEQQSPDYREHVLPTSLRARVAVEAGVRTGWERYLGAQGEFIGMSTFGASSPYKIAYEKFGLTSQAVVSAARKVLQ